jgi:hypothetical protein
VKPLPKPWLDPITGAPLPPPTSLEERSVLAKVDPDLLAWYDRMEKSPYKTVADHLAEEAHRKALGGIPYGQEHHKTNPFRGNDQTAKAQLVKRDPDLAKFYEEEAKPVEIPLFGRNRNITVTGRLTKDPLSSAIVQIAEQIHKTWVADDQTRAQAQRSAAEAELKRLQEALA